MTKEVSMRNCIKGISKLSYLLIQMADNVSREKRSKIMSSIKGKNTKPEIIVRKLLWAQGIRYRIHNRKVFGTPDISIKKQKLAIFIDGCFWHGCSNCYKAPKTNSKFWKDKLEYNKHRRTIVRHELRKNDWKILEFWEHQVSKEPDKVIKRIVSEFVQDMQ